MHTHPLIRGIESQKGSFLGSLDAGARERLLADAKLFEVPAGGMIFLATEAVDRTAIIVRGMARTHLTAADGRRSSVRHARPGAMVGSITAERAALSVQAVIACTILELNPMALRALIAEDGRIGLALIAEVARRLQDTYETLASNTFGSMRERVARHLLELATEGTHTNRLVAPVTQQGLADGVGTLREVVARVLREFRREGLIATTEGSIEILDPDALASIAGRSKANYWFSAPPGG